MTVGEGDNDLTNAQGFPEAGHYLVEHQGGCIKIQKRLNYQTDVIPYILLQKKEHHKSKI